MNDFSKMFLEVLVYSSAMIIAVLAINRIFTGKISAKLVHIFWLLVLLRLLLPVTFDSPVNIPYPSFINKPAQTATANEPTLTEPNYTVFPGDTKGVNLSYPSAGTTAEKELSANSVFKLDIKTTVIALWVAGAAFFLMMNLYKIAGYCRKIRNIKTKNPIYGEKVEMAKQELGIKKNIRAAESKYADMPLVVGILRPVILFPEGFADVVNGKKLSYIIMHELCHVKRHDLTINYIWLLTRAVHWFNPLVHIAYKSYLDTVEEACDEKVIGQLKNHERYEYSQSLLDVARLASGSNKPLLSVSLLRSNTAIRKRVMNMMHPKKKSMPFAFAAILTACIMCFACFTTACQPAKAADGTSLMDEAGDEEGDGANTQRNELLKETPMPTPIETIDLDNAAAQQPIKRNPLGSEEAAIAVAESINVSNAESFTYIMSHDRGIMKVHNVKADGNILADYQIYDFNGEICSLQTSAFMTEELGEELSPEELNQKVADFARQIYPGTTLDITNCAKDDMTWKREGVTYKSNDYIVTGRLTDSVDGSVRAFTAHIRLDGCIKSVNAEYNGMDYLELGDDVKNKVLSYADSDDAQIRLYQISDYYGVDMLHFSLGDGIGGVTLLASDMSLVDYLNIPNQTNAEFDLSDSRVDELVRKYADQYFPGNTNVVIDDEDVIDNDYVGKGKLTDSRGEMYFYIQLNGDGKVHKIGIRPNIEKKSLPKINQETALKTAIETIVDDCRFVNESRLEILSINEYKNEYYESYHFDLLYTSLNPTAYDYSLTAYVEVNANTGKTITWRIDYINDGLDVISKEEAIQKARGYITDAYNLDPDKLIFKEFMVITGGLLEFQVNFDYKDGKSYGASMFADTGELDGIGWGSSD